jgi:hypothetical protein
MTLKLIFDRRPTDGTGSFGLPAATIRNRQEQRALRWQTYECESCGFEVPMTDEIAEMFRDLDYDGERIICSTCRQAEKQQYRERKEFEDHLPDPNFKPELCDFCPKPVQCTGECWHQIVPISKAKTNTKQGKLF